MICIIAGDFHEAETWAHSQLLAKSEWFYPTNEDELIGRSNFHVLVVGTAGFNIPTSYFNKIYNLAQNRGKIGRK